ncbi:MAG: lytic transglycosylase domain-containing protein [Acidobacteriota bacterium]
MKRRSLLALGALLALSGTATAAVRIGIRDGKRYIWNDGIGSSPHETLRRTDDWLASRVSLPSLYDAAIENASRAAAVDPKLVKSVMLIESAFNPGAISRKGARGLMQLMPETATQYGVRDRFDPLENIAGGAKHLAYLLGVYGGNVEKSLAAYNAGEAAVARYGGIPPYNETRLYVNKGLTAYYGKPTLGGGFGRPRAETWAKVAGKPVRLTRDKRNRPLITTELSARRALRS